MTGLVGGIRRDDDTRPDMSLYTLGSYELLADGPSILRMSQQPRNHKYIRRRSPGTVMRLHIGQSFVEPRQRIQHPAQHVCQHPVDTVGSSYGSKHILHTGDVDEDSGVWVFGCTGVATSTDLSSARSACFLAAMAATCKRAGFSCGEGCREGPLLLEDWRRAK